MTSLHAQIAAAAAADPDAAALEFPDGTSWSYGRLLDQAARHAGALAAIGARPGDRVCALVRKSPHALALYLGCLHGGFVYVPLNPDATAVELDHLLRDPDPIAVVRSPEVRADWGGASIVLDDGDATASAVPAATRAATDLAAIVYTSGTTGRPKGAMLSHGNLAANAHTLVELWGFTSTDVLLHALPLYHVHGLFVASHCALLAGARMRFLERFDVDAVLRWLPGSTVMMGVPTFYTRLLADARLDRTTCRSVRLFVSGSAPLLAETFAEFERRTGHPILERYGMSETGMNTSNPLSGDRRPGTVGPPLPGVDVRIAGGSETGMIEVRGPNVFAGYWGMPERFAEDFTEDGYFITGDLGRIEDGYVEIVGRAKDLVISGGLNVYPKEVEERIDALHGVAESAVIGVPDRDFGEVVVAIVVAAADHRVDPEDIREALRAQLAPYKIPKRVHTIDELPRNSMGKVQKALLRERFG